jgi:hypothetical protein
MFPRQYSYCCDLCGTCVTAVITFEMQTFTCSAYEMSELGVDMFLYQVSALPSVTDKFASVVPNPVSFGSVCLCYVCSILGIEGGAFFFVMWTKRMLLSTAPTLVIVVWQSSVASTVTVSSAVWIQKHRGLITAFLCFCFCCVRPAVFICTILYHFTCVLAALYISVNRHIKTTLFMFCVSSLQAG